MKKVVFNDQMGKRKVVIYGMGSDNKISETVCFHETF